MVNLPHIGTSASLAQIAAALLYNAARQVCIAVCCMSWDELAHTGWYNERGVLKR